MSNQTEQSRAGRKKTGRIIGVVVIFLIILFLNKPSLLVFLNESQRQAVDVFRQTYFGKYLPIQTAGGSFDFIRIFTLLFMLAGCWAVNTAVEWIFGKIVLKNRHAETIKGLTANVCRYAITVFAIIFGLNMLGADILTVIASLGILALVIGFGAQSLIEDIFAGLFIIFEGRFYVGDIISVDGFRGKVRKIGVVSTQMTDAGGNVKIMNNSDIRTLTNLSEVTSVAVSIVGISYNADLRKAEQVIRELLAKMPGLYPGLFQEVPEYMGVENLGESSVDLKITANVHEDNIYNARRALNRELKLALDDAGIEIPFPQVVVWQGKEE